jgi:tRNA pseudouridine13 synthase
MDAKHAECIRQPCLTADLPGIGGRLKHVPEDFFVEEIPAYQPSGAGEHLFLWLEKRDVAAEQLTRHIARSLSISARDVGVAGLKDRRAVTRQFVSVPANCEARLSEVETESIHVLQAQRHGNKLRSGHLKGNRFRIFVRDVGDDAFERAQRIGDVIRDRGFPNYYGEQRFGADGGTLQLGLQLLRGETTPGKIDRSRRKFLQRLALSAVQSELFNRALVDRLQEGLLHRVFAGDVMQVVASGGLFVVEDAEIEQQRFERRETVITGPLFGPKMKEPAGEPQSRETAVLEASGLTPADFKRFPRLTPGARRPYVIWPAELSIHQEEGGLRFEFTLPPGCYATVLMEEFLKTGFTPATAGPYR